MFAALSGSLDDFVSSGDPVPCCRESGADQYRSSIDPRSTTPAENERPPKLLNQLPEALRTRHYSPRTESTYCQWVKRHIFFHQVRQPAEIAEPEINAFLTYLAIKHRASASTQNQALAEGFSASPEPFLRFLILKAGVLIGSV
jgi:hypothetical protein